MHFNLWDPGTALSNNLARFNLMNNICKLTQFVVSTINRETHAKHLAKNFMENVVLSFGIVAIIVVDSDNQLNIIFKDICAALGIIYWTIVRGITKVRALKNITAF